MNKFSKQLIFVAIGVAVLVAGGVLIFAVADKGAAPVGWWKFNEGSGNYAYDSSGNGNTGSLVLGGSATSSAWVSGAYGGAMSFDGTDDYVKVTSPSFKNQNFSAGAWIKTSDVSANIVGFMNTSGYYGWNFNVTTGGIVQLSITASNGGALAVATSTASVTDNNWHYVFITDDGVNMKVYIDGVLDKTASSVTKVWDTTMHSYIGVYRPEHASPSNWFTGLIDDVRIYNYARTADQIKVDYNAGKVLYVGARAADCDVSPADCINKGLVGYWDMDQMGGTTATDKSGNANTGTLTNGPKWTSGIQPFSGGRAGGGALQFDGSNDYVDAGSGVSLNTPTDYTIGMWAYNKAGSDTYPTLFNRAAQSTTNGFFWAYTSGVDEVDVNFQWSTGSGYSVTTFYSVFPKNTWTHLVFTFTNSDKALKLYVSGSQASTTRTLTNSLPVDDGTLYFGTYLGTATNYSFYGLIDDVRIYNRALSEAEIRYQYNQAKPIAHWNFNEGSASSTYDSSGQGNTGTMYGGVQWVSGVYGTAMSFDGADDYVVPSNSFGYSVWTLSAWIKPTVPISLLTPTWGVYAILQGESATTLIGLNGTGLAIYTTQIVAFDFDNKPGWHHVVYSYDGTQLTGTVDGSIRNTITIANPLSSVIQRRIGSRSDTTHNFKGLIDDVRIYNYARTAEQIKTDYNAGKALYVGTRAADCDVSPADCVNKGLVGYWDMDQMGGTTATDKSGNANTGTLGGGTASAVPIWTTGVQPFSGGRAGGGALRFDGTNDYVNVGQGSSLNGLTSITLSAWIKPYGYSSNYRSGIISRRRSSGALEGLNFDMGGTLQTPYQLAVMEAGGSAVYANTVISSTQWSFVTATLSGTAVSIYINGVLNATGTLSWNWPSDVDVSIGWVAGSTAYYFNGLIDDARIYNRALSAAEIRYQYNQAKPIAWWKMDSVGVSGAPGTALNVYDNSGNNNTGVSSGETMVNGTIGGATWKSGPDCKYGSCLSFDGINDYVDLTGLSLSNGGNITISFWANFLAYDGADYFFDIETGRLLLALNANNFQFYDGAAFKDYGAGIACAPYLNSWHHYVFTFDIVPATDIAKFYIDGTLMGSNSTYSAKNIAGGIALMSRYLRETAYVKGLVDEVRVYSTALTDAQVVALYNNNDRTAGASLEGNLVGEWRFDEVGTSYVVDTHYQRIGKYGYALTFDGTNDYVAITDSSSLYSANLTVSIWAKVLTDSNENSGIISQDGVGSNRSWVFNFDSDPTNALAFFITTDGSTIISSPTTSADSLVGTWHYFVGMIDDSAKVVRLYVDGVQIGSGTSYTGTLFNSTANVEIGRFNQGDSAVRYPPMLGDDVRIYNYARSADQIRQDYNAGALHLGQ